MAYLVLCLIVLVMGVSAAPDSRLKRDLISDAINAQLMKKAVELQQQAGDIYDDSIGKIRDAVDKSGNDPDKVKKLNEYLNKFNEARLQVVAEMSKPGNFYNGAAQVVISAKYLGTVKGLTGQLEGYLKSIANPLEAGRAKRDLISDAINMQKLKQAGIAFQRTQNSLDSAVSRIRTALLLGKHKDHEAELKLLKSQLEAESNQVKIDRLQPGVMMNGDAQMNLAIQFGMKVRHLVDQVDNILRY